VANQNFKVKKGLEVGTALTATSDGLNVTGVVTATQFSGDGSGLTGITAAGSGVVVQEEGSNVGTAATINFIGSNVTAALSGGIANVTVSAGGLSNVVEDTTPQLGGNLDLNSKDITGTGNISITGGFNATGVSTFQESVTFQSHASFGDDDKANFGAGNDLQIYHESSTNRSFIKESGAGAFFIQGSDLYLTDEDGTNMLYAANNAGVSLYYGGGKEFETTGVGVTVFGTTQTQQLNVSGISTFSGNVIIDANNQLRLGTGENSFFYVGSDNDTYLQTNNNELLIGGPTVRLQSYGSVGSAGENYLVATKDGSVDLYYNNSKKFETKSDGIDVTGEVQCDSLDVDGNADISGTVSFGSTVTFGSDDEILLGNSQELSLKYSSSSSGAIISAGGNPIDIKGTAIRLKSNSDENIIIGTTNDSVSLYYDNAKKLETSNTGVSVTGTLAATAVTGDGSGLTSLTGASAGTFGASNATPIITVDSNGRITGIATVATAGAGGGGGISNIVEDTTPQLGGNLDLNSKDITGSGDLDYTGNLKVTGISTITGVAGFSSHITLPDHAEIQVGSATGGDLKIYHQGSYSVIADEGTGELVISGSRIQLMNAARSEKFIDAFQDGAVQLYHDNALRLKTTGTGVDITDDLNVAGISTFVGSVNLQGNLDLQDDDKIMIGTGDDLQIYHNGSHSFITENGTGDLRLSANNLLLRSDDLYIQSEDGGTNAARFNSTTGVTLFRAGSTKLTTTSSGIEVTGTVAATSFTGDGSSLTGIAVTSQSNTQVTYNFGASGNNYVITGPGYSNSDNNPDLYLVRGQRYRFINATGSSHPLRIQSDTSGTAYTDGVSGSQSGTQEFNVQHDAPSILFYQCTIHSGMIGNIYITGGANWQMADVAETASAEIYTLNSVGIGTINPATKLDIIFDSDSGIKFDSVSSAAGTLITSYQGTTNSNVRQLVFDVQNFVVNTGVPQGATTTERLRITSDGSVGIGTANPGERLHLTTTSGNCKLRIDAASAASLDFYNSGTRFSDMFTDASTGNFTITNRQDADIIVRTNGTNERLRITSDGKLGIKVTSPGCQTGGIHAVHDATEGTPSFTGGEVGIFQRNFNSAQGCEIGIIGGSNSSSRINFGDKDDADIGIISYSHNDNSMRFIVSANERLRITSGGNIGINTDNPGQRLSVLNSSGDAHLELRGSSNYGVLYKRDSDGTLTGYVGSGAGVNLGNDNLAVSASKSDGALIFQTGGTAASDEAMRIESDGQVVVNRSSGAVLANTSSKLEVYNSTENLIFVSNSTAAIGQDAGIMFGPANNVYGGKIIVTSDEDFSTSANRTAHMAFHTRNDGTASERLRIAADGDVRIGDHNTVDRNAVLSINRSNSRLLEMRVGSGTDTNYVKRYAFQFVRSTSEATYNLLSLGSVTGNSHVVIEIKMYAVCAVQDQAAIITAYAHARQVNNGSYTYNVQTPTAQFIVGTGIAVGSLQWTNNGVLQYNTDANNNYTKYNTEITVWAHDRMDVGFY